MKHLHEKGTREPLRPRRRSGGQTSWRHLVKLVVYCSLIAPTLRTDIARGGASESPVTDCDNSGTVTLTDFALFTAFFDGPVTGTAGGCRCFDVDDSRSVDLRDFAVLQVAFGGPAQPSELPPNTLFVMQLAEYHERCDAGDGGDGRCDVAEACCEVQVGDPETACTQLADRWIQSCDKNADGYRDLRTALNTLGEWNDFFWEPDDTCNALALEQYPRNPTDSHYQRHVLPMCTDGSTPPKGTTICPDGQPIIQCTDGTRPVFYFDAGTTDRWIIKVQSGGDACFGPNCWREPDDRKHYSSAWRENGATRSATGLYKPFQNAPFGSYNRVILDKCVGDRNCGANTLGDVDFFDANGTPKGTGTVYFHGYRELQALLTHLTQWNGTQLTPTSQISFATHSNGSNGLYMYLDRVADFIRHDPSDGQPGLGLTGADVRGLASAYVRPSVESENLVGHPLQDIFAWTDYAPMHFDAHITAPRSTNGADAANGLWYSTLAYYDGIEFRKHRNWGAVLPEFAPGTSADDILEGVTIDQSCLDAHGLHGAGGDNVEACLDSMHVLMNHVTTPLFLAPQLYDPKIRTTDLLAHTRITESFFEIGYVPDVESICGSHDENFDCIEISQCAEGALPCEMKNTKYAEYDALDFAVHVRSIARGAVSKSPGVPEESPVASGAAVGHGVFAPEWSSHDGWLKPEKMDYQICDDVDPEGCAWQSAPLWAALKSWLEYDATVICVERDQSGVDPDRPLTVWSETTPGPLLDDRCGLAEN